MKLFKKVLAIAMASALVLTLLVGCGKDDGKTTFTVVDYLNDAAALEGKSITYKADTALDTNAKNTVTYVQKSGAKTIDELEKKVMTEDGEWDPAFVKAVSGGDTKNVYQIGFAVADPKLVTDAAKDNAGIYQAIALTDEDSLADVVVPDAVKKFHNEENPEWGYELDESKLDSTTYVGTATLTLGGKSYIVAVFRTAVKAK